MSDRAITQYLPIILASGLLALVGTPITRWLAHRVGMVDQPGLRKAHRSPVPLLGGMAIYAGLMLAFVWLGDGDWLAEGVGILGGATLMFLTGLWDDRYGMPARLKLLAQIMAAVFVIVFGVRVHLFDTLWLDGPITVVWIVGITNAVNLMDNMDGLAAGISSVAAAFFFVMAALEGQGLVASLAAALLGAALGFLFYNFAPAATFMGDAGSLTLGFMLATLGIKIEFLSRPIGATWMAPIVVLGALIFDTTLVSLSRVRRGRSPFQGGSDHTSHRLVQLGLSQPRAVLTLYVSAMSLGAFALVLTQLPVDIANLAFGVLVAAGLALLIFFERVEPRLSGDPGLVLIPGGGGFAEAVGAAARLSRNVTVLLAPRRLDGAITPSRAEVVQVVAALAEDPAAARALLEPGLSDEWWAHLPRIVNALRLHGAVAVVAGSPLEALPAIAGPPPVIKLDPDLAATVRRAQLILFGPGAPEVNVLPVLAAPGLAADLRLRSDRLACAGPPPEALAAWLGALPPTLGSGPLAAGIQHRLLARAASRAKTQA